MAMRTIIMAQVAGSGTAELKATSPVESNMNSALMLTAIDRHRPAFKNVVLLKPPLVLKAAAFEIVVEKSLVDPLEIEISTPLPPIVCLASGTNRQICNRPTEAL